jgi:hypothetical protein
MSRGLLFRSALRFGLLLGATKIALLEAARATFGVPALVAPATGFVLWTFVAGILVLAAYRLKVAAGSYPPLTAGIFHLILVFAVGQALFVGWSILLFHAIAPELLDATVEPMRAIARKLGERTGMTPEQIEQHVASITASSSPFSIEGQLVGFRNGMLPGILLSAGIAFPFRAKSGGSKTTSSSARSGSARSASGAERRSRGPPA